MRLSGLFLVVVSLSGMACAADTGSADLQTDAVSLRIERQSRRADACMEAALRPVRVVRHADTLDLVNVETGRQIRAIWPMGFAARLIDGQGEIVDYNGIVVWSRRRRPRRHWRRAGPGGSVSHLLHRQGPIPVN